MHILPIASALAVAALSAATPVFAQSSNDPFPNPINTTEGVIAVDFVEFAVIPDDAGQMPRMMLLVDEPGTRRMFVNTMRGALFSVSYDGKTVTPYVDVNDPKWNVPVQSNFSERGVQSFAFHPQFNQRGAKGYGKFYTYTDTSNIAPKPDFVPLGPGRTHDTVLLEWTAKNPAAPAYDGDAPRELFRAQQPFPNHNGGMIAFNPLTPANSPEFGLLYVGLADGGSGGDPFNMAQNLNSAFGKILRIDPLGTNSPNGKYGVPTANPFTSDGRADTLGEIYAYGVRNPQRFSWDSKEGAMYVADIGQNIVEEVSPVTAGANLGWNAWEGSFTYSAREVGTANARGDAKMTYPVAEFDHKDPLLNRGLPSPGCSSIARPRSARSRTSSFSGTTRAANSSTWTPTTCPGVARTPSGVFSSTTRGSGRRSCSSFGRRTPRRAKARRPARTCGWRSVRRDGSSCSTRATASSARLSPDVMHFRARARRRGAATCGG